MRTLILILCLSSCALSSASVDRVSLNLKTVVRVDSEHFKATIEVINRSDSDIFVQTSFSDNHHPFPVFLERRSAQGNWVLVAPCLDTMPTRSRRITKGEVLIIDRVYDLQLPATCKLQRIDPNGEYRWKLQYFKSRRDLEEYQRTEGRHSRVFSTSSQPFEIAPQSKDGRE